MNKPMLVTCYGCLDTLFSDYTTWVEMGRNNIQSICHTCKAEAESNTGTGEQTMCDGCLDHKHCYSLDGASNRCYECQIVENINEAHEYALSQQRFVPTAEDFAGISFGIIALAAIFVIGEVLR
jgi:hypothetical protein